MKETQHVQERQQLVNECHRLINAIAYQPSYAKLLSLAKAHLQMLAGYKSNRRRQ